MDTVADEMEQERVDSIWSSSWIGMNLKQQRFGRRVLKMVRAWNRNSSMSHDADKRPLKA